MKLLCNGFNLYRQLGTTDLVLEKFTEIFGGYSVNDININHSFSVLKTDGSYKVICRNKQICLSSCGKIIKMCCNDERIILVNDKGKLFKIDFANIDTPCDISNILNLPCNEQIVNVSCGSKLTIVYSDKGSLYNVPNKLVFNSENIVDIQCGREHCLLLDKFGNVYTFGRGSRGQLGHGQLDDTSEPVQVEALGGIKITQIATGGWHSCALSKDGDLYTWGWNGNGQLGLGNGEESNVSVMASQHVVDLPDSQRNVVQVACGNRHTIVLLDNNHLFGCGWNKYKQLTGIDKENFHSFTYLHDFLGENVVALKCGPWNSVVLCK
ncbi:ultraviolet-B receptor UVR8 [Anoplophora glabripennis]|uniref:ultraviolet-B receptor UVR8 n=1 Tax=Anoplophora glabripennis TaxID=217634 RepID=UPI0008737088|nr:ultraviolet-B receptor UVR8 [Anoplophora glabripennis]